MSDSPPTLVRTMVASDAVNAAMLCRAVLEETWPNPSTLPNVIADYDAEGWARYLATRRCFAATRGGRLVGVAWVFVADTTAYVGGAFVQNRRQGIGRLLLETRVDYARELGCELAHATVLVGNHASRRNLEGAGFRLVKESPRAWTFTRAV